MQINKYGFRMRKSQKHTRFILFRTNKDLLIKQTLEFWNDCCLFRFVFALPLSIYFLLTNDYLFIIVFPIIYLSFSSIIIIFLISVLSFLLSSFQLHLPRTRIDTLTNEESISLPSFQRISEKKQQQQKQSI